MGVKIGEIELATPVILAPMAGVTNAPYRRLCRRFANQQSGTDDRTAGDKGSSTGGLFVNEMVSARALVEGNEKTDKLASFDPDEAPRSQQLAGVEAAYIGEAVKRLVGEGRIDHLDLNFGCPVRKVTKNGGGGALPYKRKLFAAIVEAAVGNAGTVPVTIKMRVGIDEQHPTYLEAGRIAADLGVAAIALHGRTVAQLYSGQADWNTIGLLKEAIPEIPILGNGDIWEASDALAMMEQTDCDGVVIGRGCLGRPWLFAELGSALNGHPVPLAFTVAQVVPVMVEHAVLLLDWFGPQRGIREFRKHTGWYLKGYPVGGKTRGLLSNVSSLDELESILGGIADAPLPPENRRVARGHTRGPQKVSLPEGWLDDPNDDALANPKGDSAASGG